MRRGGFSMGSLFLGAPPFYGHPAATRSFSLLLLRPFGISVAR